MQAYAFYKDLNGIIFCDYLKAYVLDTKEQIIEKAKKKEAANKTLLFISHHGNGYSTSDHSKWLRNQIAQYNELCEDYAEDNKEMTIKVFNFD